MLLTACGLGSGTLDSGCFLRSSAIRFDCFWLCGWNGKMTNQCLFHWWAAKRRESEPFYIWMWTVRSLVFHSVRRRTVSLRDDCFSVTDEAKCCSANSYSLFFFLFVCFLHLCMYFDVLAFADLLLEIYRNRRHQSTCAHVYRTLVQLILFAVVSRCGGLVWDEQQTPHSPWWRVWMSAAGGQGASSCSTSCLGGVKLCFVFCQVVYIFVSQVV